MYVLLFVLGIGLSVGLATWGGPRARVYAVLVAVGTISFFVGLNLWVDALWFDSVGYRSRFWRMVGIRVATVVGGAIVVGAGVRVFLGNSSSWPIWVSRRPQWIGAGLGAFWGWNAWDELALFLGRVPTPLAEPMLGYSTGFYLFVLPLLGQMLWLAVAILFVPIVTMIAVSFDAKSKTLKRG